MSSNSNRIIQQLQHDFKAVGAKLTYRTYQVIFPPDRWAIATKSLRC